MVSFGARTLEQNMLRNSDSFLRAVHFAAKKHQGQRRKGSQTPYINHPIEVATFCHVIGKIEDGNTLAAAVLHDTLEDTETTYQELVDEFGLVIASTVAEVSDDKDLPKVERKRHQIETASKLSTAAQQVKLADKLSNLSDLRSQPLPGWPRLRVCGYFCWAYHSTHPIRSASPPLWERLEQLFGGPIDFNGDAIEALPPPERRPQLLEDYFDLLAGL